MGLEGFGGAARCHEARYGSAKLSFPLVYSIWRKSHLRGSYFSSGFENL
jgi:hypothetical protein